jgi:hypothetical protein
MSSEANEVIRAFITAFSSDDGHVVFRQRGGSPGYVHVVPSGFDPTRPEDRHLAVELHNGTVCVTEELQRVVNAHERPSMSIQEHPLGGSAGTSFGRFRWALTHHEIVVQRGGAPAFAAEIARWYRALTPHAKGE